MTDCTFTPDGRHIVTLSDELQLWDAETGALVASLGEKPPPAVFALSPDGRCIASTPRPLQKPPAIRVWDLATGKTLGQLDVGGSRVVSVTFSRDGRLVAAGMQDQVVRVWNARTFEELHRFDHQNRPASCAFSPDGKWLAATGGGWNEHYEIRLWRLDTGGLVKDLFGHEQDVVDCAFSPDGSRLVTASADKTLRVWDIETGRTLATLAGHTAAVTSCDWSPHGDWIVSTGADATARLWDAQSGAIRHVFVKHARVVLACAFSPDGRRVVSGDSENIAVVWDASAPASLPRARHQGPVTAAAFSPDRREVATSSWDGTVKRWHAMTGEETGSFANPETEILHDCVFSADGCRLAAASQQGRLTVWKTESGERIVSIRVSDRHPAERCVFSPDGRWLAVGAGLMRVLDARTYAILSTFPYESGWPITPGAFSPDSRHILDLCLNVHEVASGRTWSVLADPALRVRCCTYSPDGARVLATWKRGVKVWDVKTGREILAVEDQRHDSLGCAYADDGRWIVSTSKDGQLALRDAESGATAAKFFANGNLGRVAATGVHVAFGDAAGVVYLLEIKTISRDSAARAPYRGQTVP